MRMEMFFDEYGGTLVIGAGERGVRGGTAATSGGLAVQLLAVQSLVGHSGWELQELWANLTSDRVAALEWFATVNASIRTIALQPGVRGPLGSTRQQVGGNDDERALNAVLLLAIAGVGAAPASLSPNPKQLYELWHAYQAGFGNGP